MSPALVPTATVADAIDELDAKIEREVSAGDDVDHLVEIRDELEAALESVDDGDEHGEPATDGGFIADVAGAEWCPDCQRERIHCVHDRERGEQL